MLASAIMFIIICTILKHNAQNTSILDPNNSKEKVHLKKSSLKLIFPHFSFSVTVNIRELHVHGAISMQFAHHLLILANTKI